MGAARHLPYNRFILDYNTAISSSPIIYWVDANIVITIYTVLYFWKGSKADGAVHSSGVGVRKAKAAFQCDRGVLVHFVGILALYKQAWLCFATRQSHNGQVLFVTTFSNNIGGGSRIRDHKTCYSLRQKMDERKMGSSYQQFQFFVSLDFVGLDENILNAGGSKLLIQISRCFVKRSKHRA